MAVILIFEVCSNVNTIQCTSVQLLEELDMFIFEQHLATVVTIATVFLLFTPQPLRAVGVWFSCMVSSWAGVWVAGKSWSKLYLRNRKV